MYRVVTKGIAFFVGTFFAALSAAPSMDTRQILAALGVACLALVGYMDKSVANLAQENKQNTSPNGSETAV